MMVGVVHAPSAPTEAETSAQTPALHKQVEAEHWVVGNTQAPVPAAQAFAAQVPLPPQVEAQQKPPMQEPETQPVLAVQAAPAAAGPALELAPLLELDEPLTLEPLPELELLPVLTIEVVLLPPLETVVLELALVVLEAAEVVELTTEVPLPVLPLELATDELLELPPVDLEEAALVVLPLELWEVVEPLLLLLLEAPVEPEDDEEDDVVPPSPPAVELPQPPNASATVVHAARTLRVRKMNPFPKVGQVIAASLDASQDGRAIA
jgi:hypothetical protein